MPDYQAQGFMGSGDLFMAALDANDNPIGEVDVGNASSFVIPAPSIEKKERKGSRRSNFGQTITSVVGKVDQEVKFTLTDINRSNLAMAMFGTDAAYTQTAANNTATPETIVGYLGKATALAHRNLSAVAPPVVKDEATGLVTYVEDTDYEVDYQTGRITPLVGGDITEGESLEVGSTWLAITGGFSIAALANLTRNVYMRLIGRNEVDGSNHEVILHKVQIEPSGDLSWITEDLGELQFTGKIISTASGTWDFISY